MKSKTNHKKKKNGSDGKIHARPTAFLGPDYLVRPLPPPQRSPRQILRETKQKNMKDPCRPFVNPNVRGARPVHIYISHSLAPPQSPWQAEYHESIQLPNFALYTFYNPYNSRSTYYIYSLGISLFLVLYILQMYSSVGGNSL